MLEVRRNKPLSFGVKVALAVLTISVLVVSVKKYLGKKANEVQNNMESSALENNSVLLPQLYLNATLEEPESKWVAVLAEFMDGATEVKVNHGRVDVVTEKYAIEVDFLSKWKEGLGQAIHYGQETGLLSTLAVVTDEFKTLNSADRELINHIEELCLDKGVKFVLLYPSILNSS